MSKYTTTYTLRDGEKIHETTYSRPNLINYVCPHCGSYPMTYYKVDMGDWGGYFTICKCAMCYAAFDEDDKRLTQTPSPIEDDELYDLVCETAVVEFNLDETENHTPDKNQPMSRKNIIIRDDSFESECPSCGGILYEEVLMTYNYCPWCAQRLNRDFSDKVK